jgi:MOSC domain-containing protein YiiM
MKVVSVNVSLPIEIEHKGKPLMTGIFKESIKGPVSVSRENLAGDRQADLVNHGGKDKAVYAYSDENYAYWQEALRRRPMAYGQFGENLTVSGLDESIVYVGDHLQIGNSLMAVTQPRVPCFKLGIRFDNSEMPRLFLESGRTGFYMRVLDEGMVEAGDRIEIVRRGDGAISVKELFRAFFHPRVKESAHILGRALEVPELSAEWRGKIERRLQHGGSVS